MTFHNRVIITVHAYLVYLAIDLSLHLLSFSSFIGGVMHACLNGNQTVKFTCMTLLTFRNVPCNDISNAIT